MKVDVGEGEEVLQVVRRSPVPIMDGSVRDDWYMQVLWNIRKEQINPKVCLLLVVTMVATCPNLKGRCTLLEIDISKFINRGSDA